MKFLFAVLAATALTLGAAAAQTTTAQATTAQATAQSAPNSASACAALTAAPSLPDGGTANNEAMTQGNTTFMAWVTPSQQALACRRAEIEAAHTRWQALVNEYNAQAQSLNTTRAAWDAEIDQYNERGSGRPRSASTSTSASAH